MENILKSLSSIFFGSKIANTGSGYYDFEITFKTRKDAESFLEENMWLKRIFLIDIYGTRVVLVADCGGGYEPLVWLS